MKRIALTLTLLFVFVAVFTLLPGFAIADVTGDSDTLTSTITGDHDTVYMGNGDIGGTGGGTGGGNTTKELFRVPGGVLPPSTFNFIQPPTPADTARTLLLPSEMTVAEACNAAGKSSRDKTVVKITYAKSNLSDETMKEYSMTDYIGTLSENKENDYMTPLCMLVCKLGRKGAEKIIITKLAPAFEGVTKQHNYGLGFSAGGAGPASGGVGFVGLTFGAARNSLHEIWNAVGMGFKKPTPK